MKVKCINNHGVEEFVTNGKIYDVIGIEYKCSYTIDSDLGGLVTLFGSRFEVVADNKFQPVNDKIEQHKKICNELTKIYDQKNHDYGDSFGKGFKEYGMTMPCIRLEDKLLRLKSLTVQNKEQQVSDESIEDTLLDLANYTIMTILELRGGKNE